MNLLDLTTEIALWLQQDLSGTNIIWTEAKIKEAIQQAVRDFSTLRLKDSRNAEVEYTIAEVNLPANLISVFRVVKNGVTVPIIDVQKLDLTGITTPFSSTGTTQYVIDIHNTNGIRVLRLIPQATGVTENVDLWYKAQITVPSSDDDLIELNSWFIPAIKFKVLSYLLNQDNLGKDIEKSKLFTALYDVIANAIQGIFPLGSVVR